MSTFAVDPLPAPDPDTPGSLLRRIGRLLLTAGCMVLGAMIVLRAAHVRGYEADLAALITGLTTRSTTSVVSSSASFYWGLGGSEPHGLRITPECSVAFVIGPLITLLGALALLRRLSILRILTAIAVTSSMIIAINTARIGLIAYVVHASDSDSAFWWSHIVVGSILALAGNVGALAVGVRIVFGRGHRTRPLA